MAFNSDTTYDSLWRTTTAGEIIRVDKTKGSMGQM